ncbi:MAG: hypothetical protein LBL35_01580 [Clostridiales bacterium]|jgi:hypothetical protein|nr:hypothetical protein [Clostridiales bacterium]
MLAIFFAAAFITLAAFAIKSAVWGVQVKDIRPSFTIERGENIIDLTVIDDIARAVGAEEYNALRLAKGYVGGAKLTPGAWAEAMSFALKLENEEDSALSLKDLKIYMNSPSIFCQMNSALDELFVNGALSLSRGRHIAPDDMGAVVISDELSAKNAIDLGDAITINASGHMLVGDNVERIIGDEISLEVIGTFKINGSQLVDENTKESDMAENWFFADLTTCKALSGYIGHPDVMSYDSASFFVNDRADLAKAVETALNLESVDGFFELREEWPEINEAENVLNAAKRFDSARFFAPSLLAVGLFAFLFFSFRDRRFEFSEDFQSDRRRLLALVLVEELIPAVLAFAAALAAAIVYIPFLGDKFMDAVKFYAQAPEVILPPPYISSPGILPDSIGARVLAPTAARAAITYAAVICAATAAALLSVVRRPSEDKIGQDNKRVKRKSVKLAVKKPRKGARKKRREL